MNLRELFYNHVAQTSTKPLAVTINKAKGVYLYGEKGKKYLDVISGVSVSNVGHCHPKVVKAIQEQASKYMHLMVYGEIVQSPQVLLAKELTDLLPKTLNSVYFVNSGSEAIEGAIKLAKRYTGKSEILSCYNAYHGCTNGAMSVMGSEDFVKHFRPLMPDCNKIHHGSMEDLKYITPKTAAVLIEVTQGEAGVRTAGKAYWKALREKCTQTGAMLIFDEVQTGFGRSGSMFAFETIGVKPDILVIAKAMGGGLPLGAFVSQKEIMNCFTENPVLGHITTFGGHPVCCAAGLASLRIIRDEQLYKTVENKGKLYMSILPSLPHVQEVRQSGLMIAVDFKDRDLNFMVVKKLLEAGMLTDWFLFCDTALRLSPPLIINEKEIEKSCKILKSVLKKI